MALDAVETATVIHEATRLLIAYVALELFVHFARLRFSAPGCPIWTSRWITRPFIFQIVTSMMASVTVVVSVWVPATIPIVWLTSTFIISTLFLITFFNLATLVQSWISWGVLVAVLTRSTIILLTLMVPILSNSIVVWGSWSLKFDLSSVFWSHSSVAVRSFLLSMKIKS